MKKFLVLTVLMLGLGAGGGWYLQSTYGDMLIHPERDVVTTVEDKVKEEARLVLMARAGADVVMAVFTENIGDVDALIAVGDSVTFRVLPDQPMLENPSIVRVERPEPEEEESSDGGAETGPAYVSLEERLRQFRAGASSSESSDGGAEVPEGGLASDAGADGSPGPQSTEDRVHALRARFLGASETDEPAPEPLSPQERLRQLREEMATEAPEDEAPEDAAASGEANAPTDSDRPPA
ncbi:MAG: hypothetical protein AAGF12_09280 [Myxococcota bacterium]